MSIIFKILFGIAILLALLLIIALFIKNEYTIEREITINKPRLTVFNYIRYVKNQDHYNKWVMTDPNMKKEFRGTDGTVGFVYAWDGNDQAGKGEQEIREINEGESLEIEIRFLKPFAGIAQTSLRTAFIQNNQTQVNWRMEGRNPYPMNLTNLFMDKLLGKDLTTSLVTLKRKLEQ